MGGLLGRRGDLWGTIYKLLYAFLKLGQMLKGLYRFKPPDLAPKRALLGAIFTDFGKIALNPPYLGDDVLTVLYQRWYVLTNVGSQYRDLFVALPTHTHK